MKKAMIGFMKWMFLVLFVLGLTCGFFVVQTYSRNLQERGFQERTAS